MEGPLESRPPDRPRSVWENVRDVVLQPSSTFADVAERPNWLAPLLVVGIGTMIVAVLMKPALEALQFATILESEALGPDEREAALAAIEAWSWIGVVIAPVAFAIVTAILAFLFWGWAAVVGARNAEYPVALAALAYAGVVGWIQGLLQALVVGLKGAETVAREGGPPLFGLSLFLDRGDLPALAWGMIANVNLFSIWFAVLVGVAGIHALKASKGAATVAAVGVWFVQGLLTALQPPG